MMAGSQPCPIITASSHQFKHFSGVNTVLIPEGGEKIPLPEFTFQSA